MIRDQRIDERIKTVSSHDLFEVVKREIDAMIGDAPLRKIVGPDALRTIARTDLQFARDRSVAARSRSSS